MLNKNNEIIILIIKIFFILGLLMMSIMTFIVLDVKADTQVLYHKYANNTGLSYDYSEYGNDGTNYNITYANGIFNNAALFNGVNSYIEVVDPSNLSFTNDIVDSPFAVSFWIHLTPGLGQPVIEKGVYEEGTAEYTIAIPTDCYKGTFYINDNTGGYLECQTNNCLFCYSNFNRWIHVFCTYDGINDQNGMKFYINGELVNTTNVKIGAAYVCMKSTTDSLFIGRQKYIDYSYLNSYLDELILYDYAPNDVEVNTIFNNYKLEGYSIILLNEYGIINKNISVYKTNEFIEEVQFGDIIEINNTYNYTFVIETDLTDKFTSIENINDISKTSITPIIYIIIISFIIGLIWYLFKKG